MINHLCNFRISRSFNFNKFSTNTTINNNPINNNTIIKKNIIKNENSTLIEVRKSNIKQSPLRMKFLVMLIRDTWVPDAIAQLKFSPKHKAVDVGKMVKRAIAIAKLNYDAIPEELYIQEVFVTKGLQRKKLRMMGRGRTGIGRIRSTHVTIKVNKIDFNEKINHAKTLNQKNLWLKRKDIFDKIKSKIQN